MVFEILNSTGSAVTLNGTSYANGEYVSIIGVIGFGGVKYTRNDVDGSNAGRDISGNMIRDRVAIKGKWNVTLTGAMKAVDVRAIMSLVEPETFYIKTDIPSGTETEFKVYTNNIPVNFAFVRSDGTEYYSGVSLPIVEV